ERKLVFLDEDDGPPQPGVKEHLLDAGRLEGVGDEHLERIVPADDVDAFATQLIDDVLDATAADADAGADAIHLHVDARDRDLAAVASLARQRLDLDGPVLDLGDLLLEQPADELGVVARQNDLDAVAHLADVEDDGLDPFADVVRFAGDLFAPRQNGLG